MGFAIQTGMCVRAAVQAAAPWDKPEGTATVGGGRSALPPTLPPLPVLISSQFLFMPFVFLCPRLQGDQLAPGGTLGWKCQDPKTGRGLHSDP